MSTVEYTKEVEEKLKTPAKTYPAELLRNIEVDSKGKLTLSYKGHKKPLVLLPSEVSSFPLQRIPLFNILRSDSPWREVVDEWFKIFLSWKIKFFVKGDIDPVVEEKMWRNNLRLGKTTTLSFGTKGIVVPDKF